MAVGAPRRPGESWRPPWLELLIFSAPVYANPTPVDTPPKTKPTTGDKFPLPKRARARSDWPPFAALNHRNLVLPVLPSARARAPSTMGQRDQKRIHRSRPPEQIIRALGLVDDDGVKLSVLAVLDVNDGGSSLGSVV